MSFDLESIIQQEGVINDYTGIVTMDYVYRQDNTIVKITNTTDIDDKLKREAEIGLLGTNTLNSKHFAKILSFEPNIICPSELYSSDDIYRNADYYSAEALKCDRLTYEYIRGPILQEYIKTATINNLKSIYHQLFHALYQAYLAIDFTHYDLHLRNVIITTDNNQSYPVIIDYGLSHIKVKNQNYGVSILDSRIDNRSYWQHDMYKLLMHTYTEINVEFYRRIIQDLIINVLNEKTETEFWSQKFQRDLKSKQQTLQHLITKNQKEFSVNRQTEIDRLIEDTDQLKAIIESKNDLIISYDKKISEYQLKLDEFNDPQFYRPTEFLPYVVRLLEFILDGVKVDINYVLTKHRENGWFHIPQLGIYNRLNNKQGFERFMKLVDEIFI